MGVTTDGIAIVEKVQLVEKSHDSFVGVEPRRGETSGLAEVADEMTVRLFHVRPQGSVGQLMKTAAPDHVVHASVKAELVALSLKRLKQRNERQTDGPGQRGFDQKSGPAGLLDEMYRLAVGEFGFGPGHSAADPLDEVRGPAHVHKEGVGHTEIAAYSADPGEPVGSADAMIYVPAEGEQPFRHRTVLAATSR
jgi:hypothetical protein